MGRGTDMENFLALLRLALERGWTVGLLLIVFFGLALLGPAHGFPFPEEVSRWNNAGLAFGTATFAVSIAANLVRLARSIISERRDAAEVRRNDVRNARANLQLLNQNERALLINLLQSNRSRFEVQIIDPLYPLLQKGLLVEVGRCGGSGWFCDMHPGIIAIKRKLLRERLA
jgi:hypothetical protein